MSELTLEQQSELKRLMANGVLHPRSLVEAAEKITSPFHNMFEWDDSKAAENYRVWQARGIIKSFTIKVEELKIDVQAFSSLSVDRENGGGYRLTTDVMKAPDLRSELLRTALIEFSAVKQRYGHLQELASIFEAIEATQEAVLAKPAVKKTRTVAKAKRAPRKPKTTVRQDSKLKIPKIKQPKVQTRFAAIAA